MIEITSKDWFINQNIIPDEDSQEYLAFWEYQRNLCINGCFIEGVFFPPELYFHLNFWKTMVDYKTIIGGKEVVKDKLANPLLRDNEWIIFNEIDRAQREHKGLVVAGSRRISKSTSLSSYLCYGATFDENSQNVLAGTNSDDIKTMVNMMDLGLNSLPQAFRWQRVEDNWKQQVTLGIKESNNVKYPFSHIIVRNLDGGNNEEALAGTKPRRLVIDEAAKESWFDAYQAAVPGFTTSEGILQCSPIISFTGGNAEKFMDARKVMFDCEAYNFLSYPDEDNPKRTHGLFLGAKYRQEGKIDSNLGDYLNLPATHQLHEMKMKVADESKAFGITDTNLEKLRKGNDKKKYQKEKMYFPKKVDEIFLNTTTNMFNVEAARAQQIRLKDISTFKGYAVDMYHDGTEIKTKESSKEIITEYPLKNQSPDAPVCIWEHPIPNPPKFLYIFGNDPYRFGQAKYSDSLGAIYIYKRIHSITGEGFQNMLVASYVARPETKEQWYEQARLLIKYYNAYGLVENDEPSFIEYMKSKGEAEIYLAPAPKIQKSLVQNSSLNRPFGISRSPKNIRDYLHGLLKGYMDDSLETTMNEDGSVKTTLSGVTRILDQALLEEIINFNEDANVDRIVAVELALCLAGELDPMMGAVSTSGSDPRLKGFYESNKVKNTFTPKKKSVFGSSKRRSIF